MKVSEQMTTHSLRQEAQEFALRAQHRGSGVAVEGGSLPARAAPASSSTRGIVKIHPLDLRKRLYSNWFFLMSLQSEVLEPK